MRFDTIIFDLDGTLVHTAPDLLRATNHVLEQNQRRPVELADIIDTVSFGARAMIRRGFKLTGDSVSGHMLDLMFEQFLEFYNTGLAVDSHPFDGVTELLELCRQQEMKLGVCTNKLEAMSVKLLEALGLSQYFSAVVGPDTIGIAKPDAAPFGECIRRCGGDLSRAVMVGDSKTDVLTARAAGVPVIGVTFGYSDEPMEELRPDYLAGSCAEIEAVICGNLST